MKLRQLGSTQRRVTSVGLGTMPLAIQKRPAEADAIRVIHAALEAGINWLDTADSYCLSDDDVGYGEHLVARALATFSGARDSVLVTTKGGYTRPGGEWRMNGRPQHLRAACEASLRALNVSSVGLYQLHGADPGVYYPDSIGALQQLQKEGKIQHIGLCNVDIGHIADARALVDVATVQNRCNVFDRHCFANGVIDLCEKHGIAFIAHSPVGGHQGHVRIAQDSNLTRIAARYDATPYQVAIAWLLQSSPALLVIPGASKATSALASVRAAELDLSVDDRSELTRAFPTAGPLTKRLVVARAKLRHIVRNAKARHAQQP